MVQDIVEKLIPTLTNHPAHMEVIIGVMTLVESHGSLTGAEKQSLAIDVLEAVVDQLGALSLPPNERQVLRLLLANRDAIKSVITTIILLTKNAYALNGCEKTQRCFDFGAMLSRIRGSGRHRRRSLEDDA